MKRTFAVLWITAALAGSAYGQVIGNPKSKVMHTVKDVHFKTCTKSCSVEFKTIEEGFRAGYKLCGWSAEARALKAAAKKP